MDDLDFIVQETKDWKTDFSELLASAGHSTVAFVRDFNEELARFSIFTGKSKDTLKKAIGNQTSHKHIRNAVSWPQAFTKSEINNFTLQYISELIETLSFIFQTANLPKTKFIDSFLDRRGNILLRNLYPKSNLKEYIEGELTKDNFLFLTYQLGQLPESLSVVNEICNSFRRNMSFYNACAKFYTQQNAASLKKSLQKIELRPYQREAVKAIWEFFGKKRREMGIIRLPTGAGKTIVAHEIADRFLRENKNNVVIWVSKNWEILTQTAYSWAEGWGNIEWVRRIGGNPLSLGGIEEGNEGKIFFTTLHSFQSRLSKQQLPEPITDKKNVLVIYDECHWAVSATFGETLLNYFLPDSGDFAKVMGLSATPEKAFLLGDCKTNLIIQKSWKEISEYLATPEVEFLDTNIVWEPLIDKYFNTINYQSFKELSLNGARNEMIIQWINQGLEAGKYTKVVLFAIDIDHARTLAELLGQKNISADLIHTGLIGNRNQTISKSLSENS